MSSALHPDRIWWSATEIAEARLPDMPATKRGVNILADRQGWTGDRSRARRRAGRGGGWEFHWELLPSRARAKLLRDAAPRDEPEPAAETREEVHARFEGLRDADKSNARRRLRVLQAALAMERAGLTKNLAVIQTGAAEGVSARSIWNWFGLVEGVPETDWLYHLAPRRAGRRATNRIAVNTEFMTRLDPMIAVS